MANIIYYFTGTGNSLALAKMVAEELGDTEVISMFALRENSVVSPDYNKVGFVFPTYFSEPPKIVSEIVSNVQINSEQKVFVIATCGGSDGLARKDFSNIVQPKTKHTLQTFCVPMPPNHIVGFSPFPKFVQNIYLGRAERVAKKIARKVQHGTPTKPPKEMDREKRRKMHENFNGRMGIKDIYSQKAEFFTTEKCSRCGICEKLCKVDNIKCSKECVLFGDNCYQCMACIQWCPNAAIAHPNVPKNRKHYHHPDIKLEDMI